MGEDYHVCFLAAGRLLSGRWSSAFWPLVVCFLVIRYRLFLRTFLETLSGRMQTDHVKLGWFEIRPKDQFIVLDPEDASNSTSRFDPADIARIERMFEFIADEGNLEELTNWVNQNVDATLDVEDFLTLPRYANERQQAFGQVEGLGS